MKKTQVIQPNTIIFDLNIDGNAVTLQATETKMIHGLKCRHCALIYSSDYCNKGYFKCRPSQRPDHLNLYFEKITFNPVGTGLYWVRLRGRQDWQIGEFIAENGLVKVSNHNDIFYFSEEISEFGERVMTIKEAMDEVWQPVA